MPTGSEDEARMMTGLLTGYICASLTNATQSFLVKPITFERVSVPDGVIDVRLASGMLTTITVHVEPVSPDETA